MTGKPVVFGELVDVPWLNAGAINIYDSTAGGAVANFDITPIVGSYNSLLLLGSLRGDTALAQTSCGIRFNNDSGANYTWQELRGIAAAASATSATGANSGFLSAIGVAAASASAGLFSPVVAVLPNYAAAQAHNLLSWSAYGGSPGVSETYSFWVTANAITRITILPGAGNWVAGSRVSLWALGS
jgi:hypothetical protein